MSEGALDRNKPYLHEVPTSIPAKEAEDLVEDRRRISLVKLNSVPTPPDPQSLKLRGAKKIEAVLDHIAAHQDGIGNKTRFLILHKLMVALENKKSNFNFVDLRGHFKELDMFEYKKELVQLAYELSNMGIALKRSRGNKGGRGDEDSMNTGGLHLDWFQQGDLVPWEVYSKSIDGEADTVDFSDALTYVAKLKIPASIQRHKTCGSRKGDSAFNDIELVKIEDLELNPAILKTLKSILNPDDDQTMVILCQHPQRVAKVETRLLKEVNEDGNFDNSEK